MDGIDSENRSGVSDLEYGEFPLAEYLGFDLEVLSHGEVTAVEDDCGVCGGDNACLGCTDPDAYN